MTQAAARLAAQHGNTEQAKRSLTQQQHVPKLCSAVGVDHKRAVADSGAVISAAANVPQLGCTGLVEDEIDWSNSISVDQASGSYAVQPHSEHCWTTQFLEQESMQAPANHLPPGMACEAAAVGCESRDQCIFPVKHGTSAWVEDDIQWD